LWVRDLVQEVGVFVCFPLGGLKYYVFSFPLFWWGGLTSPHLRVNFSYSIFVVFTGVLSLRGGGVCYTRAYRSYAGLCLYVQPCSQR
jgi:hypothetical protein